MTIMDVINQFDDYANTCLAHYAKDRGERLPNLYD